MTKPAFLFPGQGSQWIGMGAQLLDSSKVFAEQLNRCEKALGEHVEWSLIDVIRGAPGAPGLDRVDVVQPVLWAMMVSLAELWRSVGVHPDAVIGHSLGEIAAAYVAGALSRLLAHHEPGAIYDAVAVNDRYAARLDDRWEVNFFCHFSELGAIEVGLEPVPGGAAIRDRPHDRIDAKK